MELLLELLLKIKKLQNLDKDLQNSLERWVVMCKKIRTLKAQQTPIKVLSELNRASSILRDLFNDSFTSIVTNDETLFLETKEYLTRNCSR